MQAKGALPLGERSFLRPRPATFVHRPVFDGAFNRSAMGGATQPRKPRRAGSTSDKQAV